MYKKLIVFVLVMALAGSASALMVDYALIDFGSSGSAGANETQVGLGRVEEPPPYVFNGTSLTSDDYTITFTTTGGGTINWGSDNPSPAGAPFTDTQKQGIVERDNVATALNIAFTDLAPGDYILYAAAGYDNESRWPLWSATAGASVSDLTGTTGKATQAEWSFTVTSETGAQITINAANEGETSRGKVAAMTLTYIPEPATIMLLGLGGLALIRRKR